MGLNVLGYRNPTYCSNVAILPVVPKDLPISRRFTAANFLDSGTGFWEFNYAGEACEARVY